MWRGTCGWAGGRRRRSRRRGGRTTPARERLLPDVAPSGAVGGRGLARGVGGELGDLLLRGVPGAAAGLAGGGVPALHAALHLDELLVAVAELGFGGRAGSLGIGGGVAAAVLPQPGDAVRDDGGRGVGGAPDAQII